MAIDYGWPWYEELSDDSTLMQGDIVWDCYVLKTPEDITEENIKNLKITTDLIHTNVIIVSQSCDLVEGLEKVDTVLCAPIYKLSEYEQSIKDFSALGKEKKEKKREILRLGNIPGTHVINFYSDAIYNTTEYVVVDFHKFFTFNIDYMRKLVKGKGKRLRLASPYREQLSHSFSKHITRVGLPQGKDLKQYLKYPEQ